MIEKCNIYKLEKLTGIIPRDNWYYKARAEQVYFIKESKQIIAFLYLKDAKEYLKAK